MGIRFRATYKQIDLELRGAQRLAEFCAVNPSESVIALREGSFLHLHDDRLRYHSVRNEDFKVFRHGEPIQAYHDTRALQPLVPFRCD